MLRRRLLQTMLGAAALPAIPAWSAAGTARELTWDDLLPEHERELIIDRLNRAHLTGEDPFLPPPENAPTIVTDYNGQVIKLPGYAVPLEFSGTEVSTFLLVPYIGACIHVPPPPPNQLVLVTPRTSFAQDNMWDPIYASGQFTATSVTTELAEVGYAMTDAEIAPYFQ